MAPGTTCPLRTERPLSASVCLLSWKGITGMRMVSDSGTAACYRTSYREAEGSQRRTAVAEEPLGPDSRVAPPEACSQVDWRGHGEAFTAGLEQLPCQSRSPPRGCVTQSVYCT